MPNFKDMAPRTAAAERETGAPSKAWERPPSWSLDDLFTSADDPEINEMLDQAATEARALTGQYKGQMAQLTGTEFGELLKRYDALQDQMGRVASYAQLLHAAHRDDEAVGRFYQTCLERLNGIGSDLLFITLELNRIDDDCVEAWLQTPDVARYRSWIATVRLFKPHQLTDEVEAKLHDRSVTGRSAWVRLFDETMADMRYDFRGDELTNAQIFDKLSSPDRDERKDAASAISARLSQSTRLFTRINNTLIKDKQIEDDWRGYARPISPRNLGNQVEDEVVDALITSVKAAYPRLSHRYYQLKAKWMDLPVLEYWDRNAPLPNDADTRKSWSDAKIVVLDAYRQFSPTLAGIVSDFFEHRWIDADPRPGKDSGAFCHPSVPSAHPFVLMNYQGRNRDVMTLAHELGHGVHQVLASELGPMLSSTPLTLAETASVFGEQLTFRALVDQEADAYKRSLLLAGKIEDMINTVIRQIAFCDFEIRVHDARRQSELTADQFNTIWMDVQKESLGPAFNLDESYRFFWSYIPHFIHVPFYVYAYAFGDCLVNSLYQVYQDQPEGFEPLYLDMLKAGGTKRHDELLKPFGLDARDPEFWNRGLAHMETLIDELETSLRLQNA